MSSTLVVEPGCMLGVNVVSCGPGGVLVRVVGDCLGECGRADARLVREVPNSGYWPATVFCECGDDWSDDFLNPRFGDRDGWRDVARERWLARWEAALPVGTRPIFNPELAWLTGVTLPDGTVLDRDDT